uniref:Glycerate kinase n=1 Tax=Anopheles minimus TaxID=112268 RepID=A0A182W7F4_9DIPT
MSTSTSANVNKLRELFSCGVEAVKPKSLFEVHYKASTEIHKSFNHDHKRYHVIGFGKGVLGMAVQMEKLLGSRLCSGCISIPLGTSERFAGDEDFSLSPNSVIEVIECARNNLPDERSLMAAGKIKQLAHSMTAEDILCVLVSGGGSALLCLPKSPITLPEKLQIIKSLSTAGASIDELNYVRIAISDVKGGQLALEARKAFRVYSYIISDVVGDPIALIASGPTVVPKGVDLEGNVVELSAMYVELAGLLNNFKNGLLSEDILIDKLKIILLKLRSPDVETNELVRKVVKWKTEPLLIIGAGEPTVCVSGSGKGGRNQELALRFSYGVRELGNVTDSVCFLSAGTDGIDGPTDVAGAIGGVFVTKEYDESFHRDGKSFIDNNDSYRFYETLNGNYFIMSHSVGEETPEEVNRKTAIIYGYLMREDGL